MSFILESAYRRISRKFQDLGAAVNERMLVETIRRKASRNRPPYLKLGIGDDCAIVQPPAGQDLVFTTDMTIKDVHFLASHPADAVGHKTLARGLSDIAAMGANPRFCLLSLAVPKRTGQRWIDEFFNGLLALAARTGAPLAGGDLSHAERITGDIVVCGSVPRGAALRRSGAKAGDRIFVSGPLGASALGLATRNGEPWQRHIRPEPRLDFGRSLSGVASAAMDLSDGLSLDLHRLCLASGLAAAIDEEPPVYPGATIEQALHGGEDYELLFTIPPGRSAPTGSLPIGAMKRGKPGTIEYRGRTLPPLGYDHFSK